MRELARLWMETLGRDEVSVTDRFLDLGGHSLQAGDPGRRVLDRFRVTLPLTTRLQAETIEAMATLVAASLAADAEPARLESLLEDLGR